MNRPATDAPCCLEPSGDALGEQVPRPRPPLRPRRPRAPSPRDLGGEQWGHELVASPPLGTAHTHHRQAPHHLGAIYLDHVAQRQAQGLDRRPNRQGVHLGPRTDHPQRRSTFGAVQHLRRTLCEGAVVVMVVPRHGRTTSLFDAGHHGAPQHPSRHSRRPSAPKPNVYVLDLAEPWATGTLSPKRGHAAPACQQSTARAPCQYGGVKGSRRRTTRPSGRPPTASTGRCRTLMSVA